MSRELAIIVPVYDEEENILPMVREVSDAMKNVAIDYELVFVDDASKDSTWHRIQELRKSNPRVRGMRHLKNAGQSAALWTGILNTTTPLIATLDGDLQNDPADLPKLIAEIKSVDFVCGVRTKRKDTWVRRVSSKVARMARKSALGVDFADTGCAFRVFKRSTLDGLFGFNGLHRFLPVLVHGGGHSTKEIPINHRARVAGVSKYGVFNRLGRGIYDLIAIAWYQRRRVHRQAISEE
ncbi:MAG TPA: glycosyltransferase family 2 protein [Verrucomicrobiae bacterium]|nr:glycosyltransferase family 2 protein [Verrucomicrobiae bacterium]